MNKLYFTDRNDDRAIDADSVVVIDGEVASVQDTMGRMYSGRSVEVRTDRDFIPVTDLGVSLSLGDVIYLDRSSLEKWIVRQGWYQVDGNPAIYGWYLESSPPGKIRSLYLKDLDSLTMVQSHTQTVIGGGVTYPSDHCHHHDVHDHCHHNHCSPEPPVININCNCGSGGTITPPETNHYVVKETDGSHSGGKYILANADGSHSGDKYVLRTS